MSNLTSPARDVQICASRWLSRPGMKTTEITRVKLMKRCGDRGDARPPLENQISEQRRISPPLPKMRHGLVFPDSTATSVNLIQKCLDPAAAAAFVEFPNHFATLAALNN